MASEFSVVISSTIKNISVSLISNSTLSCHKTMRSFRVTTMGRKEISERLHMPLTTRLTPLQDQGRTGSHFLSSSLFYILTPKRPLFGLKFQLLQISNQHPSNIMFKRDGSFLYRFKPQQLMLFNIKL